MKVDEYCEHTSPVRKDGVRVTAGHRRIIYSGKLCRACYYQFLREKYYGKGDDKK